METVTIETMYQFISMYKMIIQQFQTPHHYHSFVCQQHHTLQKNEISINVYNKEARKKSQLNKWELL